MPIPGLGGSAAFRKIIIDKAGRYRRAGRFVSKAAYRSQQWRMTGGKAGTARRASRAASIEQALRAELGAPPAGKEWFQIAAKYPERFENYMEEFR